MTRRIHNRHPIDFNPDNFQCRKKGEPVPPERLKRGRTEEGNLPGCPPLVPADLVHLPDDVSGPDAPQEVLLEDRDFFVIRVAGSPARAPVELYWRYRRRYILLARINRMDQAMPVTKLFLKTVNPLAALGVTVTDHALFGPRNDSICAVWMQRYEFAERLMRNESALR